MLLAFIAAGMLLVALLVVASPHPPAIPDWVHNADGLDAYLEKLVQVGAPPGLAVAVIRDGQMVFNRVYGIAEPFNAAPVTRDTRFHWWSMTKMATALGVLQLVDQRRIALEDPVAKYLPFFRVHMGSQDAAPITIRMLLNHSSGLKDTMPAMMGWVHFDDANRNQTELLRQILPDYAKLRDAPGHSRAYSNLGYIALGAVIESVTGARYEHYIETEVLAPQGIEQTGFLYPAPRSVVDAAGSHPLVNMFTPLLPFYVPMGKLIATRTGTRLWFNRFYIDATPSTGLIGTAGDAARLAWAFAESSRVLRSETLTLTRQNGGNIPLGWEGFSHGGTPWYQHRGGGPGFASIMRLYPEKHLAIAVLANSTNLKREALCDLIAGVDWGL